MCLMIDANNINKQRCETLFCQYGDRADEYDDDHPPNGQGSLCLLLVHLTAQVPEAAAEAKVGDLGGLVVIHEDVPGCQVTMDDLEKYHMLS